MNIYLQGLTMGLAYVAPIGLQNLFVINSALTQKRSQVYITALIVILWDVSLGVACFLGAGALMQAMPWLQKNISHSGKVSNDFSLFRRFCCINRCFRCSCGKFSIVHGVQAAIGFQAVAIGEKGGLPETHPVQPRTESKRPCRLTRAKPASKGSDRALSV